MRDNSAANSSRMLGSCSKSGAFLPCLGSLRSAGFGLNRRPGHRAQACDLPAPRELVRAFEVQCRWVFCWQADQLRPVSDRGARQPLPNGIATAIRLDDDVDRLDPVQVPSITLFAPIGGTGYAERRNPVEPERVAVGLPFDQNHLASFLRLGETVKAVEAGFVPDFQRKRSPSSAIRNRTASSSPSAPRYGMRRAGLWS